MSTLSSALKHKVILQNRVMTGPDKFGGVTVDWADEMTLFANVKPLRGNEQFERLSLPQTVASVHARITIRRRNGLDPAKNRIKHGRTIYDILAVLQDIKNYETQLLCVATEIDQEDGGGVNP
jgi:phage head-tail adaptor, putative, SPP1 family